LVDSIEKIYIQQTIMKMTVIINP